MKKMYVDGYDFYGMEIMKYYSAPSTWTNEKRKDEVQKRIFSGEWMAARKMDGAFFEFICDDDGNKVLIGRSVSTSGDYLDKIDIVPQLHEFFNALPKGTVLLGEIYLPQHEGAKNTTSITNCLPEKAIARQNSSEDMKLHYYIFDCLAYNGQNLVNSPAEERFAMVGSIAAEYGSPYVEFADYKTGKELWDELQMILAEGGEGIVLIKNDSKYEPGKRSTKVSMKVKKELSETIDCVVIGANPPTREYTGKQLDLWDYWEYTRTGEKVSGDHYKEYIHGDAIEPVTKNYFYNWCGSWKIGLYKDGELVHIGDLSGLTDEEKENWKNYLGKVVEVGGMEIFHDTVGNGIRHPKKLGFRVDKTPKECLYEQLTDK